MPKDESTGPGSYEVEVVNPGARPGSGGPQNYPAPTRIYFADHAPSAQIV